MLVDTQGNVKLADFGFAAEFTLEQVTLCLLPHALHALRPHKNYHPAIQTKRQTTVGTPFWMVLLTT